MDIERIWQQNAGNDEALNIMLQTSDFSHLNSKMPLKKLKKNLLIGLSFAAVITGIYLAVLFSVNIWQVHIVMAILCVFNIIIALDGLKLYKSINETITASNSLKEELQKNYAGFQRWWRVQERLGLFVYPIAAAGGFIMGGVLGSDKPVEAFLYNPKMVLILGVTVLALVPLCYFGARWMFSFVYGKHLKKLKLLIEELSA